MVLYENREILRLCKNCAIECETSGRMQYILAKTAKTTSIYIFIDCDRKSNDPTPQRDETLNQKPYDKPQFCVYMHATIKMAPLLLVRT